MNVENLEVWKKSIALATVIYHHTSSFPKSELYGLTSQIRRSAVSISSNIAEGAGRGTDRDFGRFISIARGSALELKTQLIISQEIGFLDRAIVKTCNDQIDEVTRMLSGLRNKLEHTSQNNAHRSPLTPHHDSYN